MMGYAASCPNSRRKTVLRPNGFIGTKVMVFMVPRPGIVEVDAARLEEGMCSSIWGRPCIVILERLLRPCPK